MMNGGGPGLTTYYIPAVPGITISPTVSPELLTRRLGTPYNYDYTGAYGLSFQPPPMPINSPSQARRKRRSPSKSIGRKKEVCARAPPFPQRSDVPDCQFFLAHGRCSYGSNCRYNHPAKRTAIDEPLMYNKQGLPLRPGREPCSHYMRTKVCKYGPTCRFDHPDPDAAKRAAVHKAMSSGYRPMAPLIPSQNKKPASAQHDKETRDSSWRSALFYPLPISLDDVQKSLPQRSGKRPCLRFLTTGMCNFGTDCVFHHPYDILKDLIKRYEDEQKRNPNAATSSTAAAAADAIQSQNQPPKAAPPPPAVAAEDSAAQMKRNAAKSKRISKVTSALAAFDDF